MRLSRVCVRVDSGWFCGWMAKAEMQQPVLARAWLNEKPATALNSRAPIAQVLPFHSPVRYPRKRILAFGVYVAFPALRPTSNFR